MRMSGKHSASQRCPSVPDSPHVAHVPPVHVWSPMLSHWVTAVQVQCGYAPLRHASPHATPPPEANAPPAGQVKQLVPLPHPAHPDWHVFVERQRSTFPEQLLQVVAAVQLPLQITPAQAQTPLLHVSLDAQAKADPQPPQLLLSVLKSTHRPLHAV